MSEKVSITIDVPNLREGVKFYEEAFGFAKRAEPIPGLVVLHGLNVELCLLEKAAGSRSSINAHELRRYERHWTPVHLDIHVDNLETALARAVAAGASKEQIVEDPEHGSAAFCADPFGHGFCLIERKRKTRPAA